MRLVKCLFKPKLKLVKCKHCNQDFYSTRSDAERCKACRKKYLQEWRKKPATIRRKKELHRKLREKAFAGYGGCCQCCGEKNFEFLALDHVNGGGRKEREKLSTHQIARKVINQNFPDTYRVLCHNCNQSIGWYGYCPHQKKNLHNYLLQGMLSLNKKR